MKTIGLLSSRTRQTEADYQRLHQAFAVIYEVGDTIATLACAAHVDPFAQRLVAEYDIALFTIYRVEGTVTRSTRNRQFITAAQILLALPPQGVTPYASGTQEILTAFRSLHLAQALISL